jgi:hypothetical protein
MRVSAQPQPFVAEGSVKTVHQFLWLPKTLEDENGTLTTRWLRWEPVACIFERRISFHNEERTLFKTRWWADSWAHERKAHAVFLWTPKDKSAPGRSFPL